MFHTITRSLLTTQTTTPLFHLRRPHHLITTSLKMSTTPTTATTIEHIVLFKVKPTTTPPQLTSMLNGLNSLKTLTPVNHLTAGPVHKTRSTSFAFTHMLHSQYNSKEGLAQYSADPAHVDVVKSYVLPICDDIMSLDWVAHNITGSPEPGSALRVQLIKLKEGLSESDKGVVLDVVKGVSEKISGVNEISYGENFSPSRAKGFSIGSIGYFRNVDGLNSSDDDLEVEKEKEKVRELIDDLVVVDFVVPCNSNSSSL